MHRRARTLLISSVALLATLVVGTMLLDWLLAAQREHMVQQASDLLGRPLAVERLTVSWRGGPGLRAQDVRIGDEPARETQDVFHAASVTLTLRLLPLLGGNRAVAVNVEDGIIENFNVLQELLAHRTDASVIGELLSLRLTSQYGALVAAPQTRFAHAHVSLVVADQVLHTDELLVEATDMALHAHGDVTLAGNLDLTGTVVLSPHFSAEIVAGVKAARYLTDDEGQITLPFTWRGRVGQAKPRLDATLIATVLQRAGLGDAAQFLDQLLHSPTPPVTPPAGHHPLGQKLRSLLGH